MQTASKQDGSVQRSMESTVLPPIQGQYSSAKSALNENSQVDPNFHIERSMEHSPSRNLKTMSRGSKKKTAPAVNRSAQQFGTNPSKTGSRLQTLKFDSSAAMSKHPSVRDPVLSNSVQSPPSTLKMLRKREFA